MSDTSVLEQVTREVTYGGEALKVTPLTVGRIPAFARAIAPMFAALAGSIVSVPPDGQAGEGGGLNIDIEELLNLIGDHGDLLIEAVGIAIDKPKEWVAAGNPVDFIDLLVVVVEVNADFFARAMAKARRAAGHTRSSISSNLAIATGT